MPAATLYHQVICHPDNAAVFRHVDKCTFRRVLHDDGNGHRKIKVAHEASWRFLWLKGTFTTRLDVEEDDNTMTMTFDLDPNGGTGIMKEFHGKWTIKPHPKNPQHACLATLDQDLALGVYMPPPLDRLLKRICWNQTKRIFEDVQREAVKVNAGKPTLCNWEEVRDKQFGADDEEVAASAAAGNGHLAVEADAAGAGKEAGAEEAAADAEAARQVLASLELKQG